MANDQLSRDEIVRRRGEYSASFEAMRELAADARFQAILWTRLAELQERNEREERATA